MSTRDNNKEEQEEKLFSIPDIIEFIKNEQHEYSINRHKPLTVTKLIEILEDLNKVYK